MLPRGRCNLHRRRKPGRGSYRWGRGGRIRGSVTVASECQTGEAQAGQGGKKGLSLGA